MTTTTDLPNLLANTSAEGLLTTFASLTHAIHRREADGGRAGNDRRRRDLVRDEILRRMGGAT